MEIYENMKVYMEKKNISNLRQLSFISGIPYTTLISIKNKKMDIRLSTAKKICEVLDMSLDELIK